MPVERPVRSTRTPSVAPAAILGDILLLAENPQAWPDLVPCLETAGYRVTCAPPTSPPSSLHLPAPPAVLLCALDDALREDGAWLARWRQCHAATPVMALSAHDDTNAAAAVVRAIRHGVSSCLDWPSAPSALRARMSRAVALSGTSTETGTIESIATTANAASAADTYAAAATSSPPPVWCAEIVTRNAAMRTLLDQVSQVADGEASILIQGASGSGKELLARAVHRASPRAERPFVGINCSAIPEHLLESELFGYLRGAFTGATRDHPGLFREADGGTLFLDEIGDLSLSLQVKLLRVLQEREIRPLGATHTTPVDVRIVSATLRNLEEATAAGRFRSDLFYRLNVVTVHLPSLCERREDIPLLAHTFLQALARDYGKAISGFTPKAMEHLVNAPWPGNVRQLYNTVERAVALSVAPLIPAALVRDSSRETDDVLALEPARMRFEQHYLIQVLRISGGNVTRAAQLAQRNRTYFYKLLERHQLDPGMFAR